MVCTTTKPLPAVNTCANIGEQQSSVLEPVSHAWLNKNSSVTSSLSVMMSCRSAVVLVAQSSFIFSSWYLWCCRVLRWSLKVRLNHNPQHLLSPDFHQSTAWASEHETSSLEAPQCPEWGVNKPAPRLLLWMAGVLPLHAPTLHGSLKCDVSRTPPAPIVRNTFFY